MEINGTGNQNSVILDCPKFSQSDNDLLDFFSFWVEGVLTTIVAILGIFGNTIVSIIIVQKEMRNSFNLLLVSLACFDSTYVSIFIFKLNTEITYVPIKFSHVPSMLG